MNHEVYLQKVKELEKEFKNKKVTLTKEFITSNNPYKIGDKVTDRIGSIIIEKIGYSWGYDNKPCAIYSGLELRKDGIPTKRGLRRTVWQSNIV